MYAVFTMEQSFWLILLETPRLGFGDENTSLSWALVLLDWHSQLLWISPISLNSIFIDWEGALGWPSMGTIWMMCLLCSVHISHSVMSDSLQSHESQHARPPCPSPTPGVHSNLRPSSRWCHSAISSSVVPFSFSPNPSQHQSLFQWVNSSHEVAKVLEFQL